MGSKHDEKWYEERRKKIFWFTVGVIALGIFLTISSLTSEYRDLQSSGNQHAADRLVRTVILVILGLVTIAVVVAWCYFGRVARSVSARMEAEFEASIANLSPEEQVFARSKRAAYKAAMAIGAYAVAHEAFEVWHHHQQEDLRQTRERNARINALLEEGRQNRHTSWDDPV